MESERNACGSIGGSYSNVSHSRRRDAIELINRCFQSVVESELKVGAEREREVRERENKECERREREAREHKEKELEARERERRQREVRDLEESARERERVMSKYNIDAEYLAKIERGRPCGFTLERWIENVEWRARTGRLLIGG